MNVQRKDASIQNTGPVDDFPGSFEVVLSAPTKDRDGDTLRPEDWKQPLPEHITFDMDHGMSVATTVGSGTPRIDPDTGNLIVSGTYSSLPRAQEVRTLVNEGHIRTTSVAFMKEPSTTKDGKPSQVRELLNGAFVAVPSNREALVLSSKSVEGKAGARNSSRDRALIQSAHDALVELGADCGPMDDTGAADGAVSGAAFGGDAVLKAKYTAQQRRDMAKAGHAMPDGSFPIGDREDLESAIRLNGHGNGSQSKVRDFIKRRAASLGLSDLIPESWKSFEGAESKAPSFTPLKRGTHVSWRYRATRGHGVIEGVHKMGTTHANTEYSIRESDHHVSASGSHEPSIVYHYGSDITVESGKAAADAVVKDGTPAELAQGTDAALDQALALLQGVDLTGLPENVAQAITLLQAADASSDQLLDAMGVDDPDDDEQKKLQARVFMLNVEARSA